MDKSNYFYNKDRDDIYHPFSDYNESKFFPEESLTKQLYLFRLIYDDVSCLSEIYAEQKDPHRKRAILKYIIMDICSMYDKFQEFKNLIIECQSIKCEQQKEILKKINQFLQELREFSKNGKYRKVRNKLSAHRDKKIALPEVKKIWNNLSREDVNYVIKKTEDFYNDYLKILGIYQWAKFNKHGTIEIVNDSPFVEIIEKKQKTKKNNQKSSNNN
ncbi:hypothetical protein KAW43_01135 [Candidatus Parcubacteria bacterium]|nr:hypothetical protein [Candidatus Parcubacteria bacterium]